MAKLDTERLIKRVEVVLKAGITAKLAEITAEYLTEDTAEYGGTVTLDDIPSANYFRNGPPDDLNMKVWLVIGVQSISAVSRGPAVAKAMELFILIGHAGLRNNATHNLVESKLLRYARAVEEVLGTNFAKIAAGCSLVEITQMPAQSELQNDSGETLRIAGLSFGVNIA